MAFEIELTWTTPHSGNTGAYWLLEESSGSHISMRLRSAKQRSRSVSETVKVQSSDLKTGKTLIKRKNLSETNGKSATKRSKKVTNETLTTTTVQSVSSNGEGGLSLEPHGIPMRMETSPGGIIALRTPPLTPSRSVIPTTSSPRKFLYLPTLSSHSTLLETAEAHLKSCDSRFHGLIERHHCNIFSPLGLTKAIDPYKYLVCGILSQQVSGAAARSITNKFVKLFDLHEPDFPTPDVVVSKSVPDLRTAGLSARKAEYIVGLSERFLDGRVSAESLVHSTDEDVITALSQVRGIGVWS